MVGVVWELIGMLRQGGGVSVWCDGNLVCIVILVGIVKQLCALLVQSLAEVL